MKKGRGHDLRGQVFGRLTAIEPIGANKHKNIMWRCLCTCGKESFPTATQLVRTKTQSCGCLQREVVRKMSVERVRPPRATPEFIREYGRKTRTNRKTKVLSYYGPHGNLQCCADLCFVRDLDMLTLDHIDDSGAQHRRDLNIRGGQLMYQWVIKNGFPKGFQTLCWNHQAQKAFAVSRAA